MAYLKLNTIAKRRAAARELDRMISRIATLRMGTVTRFDKNPELSHDHAKSAAYLETAREALCRAAFYMADADRGKHAKARKKRRRFDMDKNTPGPQLRGAGSTANAVLKAIKGGQSSDIH